MGRGIKLHLLERLKDCVDKPGMIIHACNPNTLEVETGGF
jgi:hypothetical protein